MAELLKTKRQSSAIQSARVGRILEIATDTELKKVEKNFTFLATVCLLYTSPSPRDGT